jgi:hypothetical protein
MNTHKITSKQNNQLNKELTQNVPNYSRLQGIRDGLPQRVASLLLQQVVSHDFSDKLLRLVRDLQYVQFCARTGRYKKRRRKL